MFTRLRVSIYPYVYNRCRVLPDFNYASMTLAKKMVVR